MMKKRSSFTLILTLLGLFLSGMVSCQKDSVNGNLDGRWQILEIETPNGVKNVKDQQLYYNFYMHVCNLSYYSGIFAEANFFFEDNTITLEFPYLNTTQHYDRLQEYGIYSNPVLFHVSYLDKKKLIMENDESIITCRKF